MNIIFGKVRILKQKCCLAHFSSKILKKIYFVVIIDAHNLKLL